MENLKELTEWVAIISACWTIISGIGAWKREFIGKRKIELAEETMAAFFAVKDAIAQIRNPFSMVSEGSSRKRQDDESEDEARMLDQGFVVIERYQKQEAVIIAFSKLKYRFMAVFGAETEALFIQVHKDLNSIFTSARMLSTHYWKRHGRASTSEEGHQRYLSEMRRHEAIFWDQQDDDDVIRKSLKDTEAKFTAVITPVMQEYTKSMSSWWQRLYIKTLLKWY